MPRKRPPIAAARPLRVTRETLDDTPARAFKLLRGIGISAPIRAALEQRGFGAEDHHEGWTFLQAASGYPPASPAATLGIGGATPGYTAGGTDIARRDAYAALDAWDEDGLRIVRATLERRFPVQAAAVLDGLTATKGPAALIGVLTLLDRLDRLETSRDKTDRAALAMLAKRGIDAAERARLKALVTTARSGKKVSRAAQKLADTRARDAEAAQTAAATAHLDALIALREWYEEWSAVARAVVKRRDWLVLLGMAKRKPPTKAEWAKGATK